MMDTIKQQEEEIKQLKSRLKKSVEVFKEQQKTINELRELVKKYYIIKQEDEHTKVEEQQNTSKNIFDPVKATFTI